MAQTNLAWILATASDDTLRNGSRALLYELGIPYRENEM